MGCPGLGSEGRKAPSPTWFGSVGYRTLEVDVRYMRGNGEAHIVWKSSLGYRVSFEGSLGWSLFPLLLHP